MLAEPSPTPGHPEESGERGVDFSTLGAMQSRAAVLAALAAQQNLGDPPATDDADAVIGSSAEVSWRGGWFALAATMLARAVLAMVAGLLFWSLVPVALGWHPTVVMTGSMEPRLHPGDVVVSRPVPGSALKLGQVILADDPDHAGRLRLHRLAAFNPDGSLTLRGDANAANDSSPVRRSAVHGVASLRIPYLGRVQLWRSEGNTAALGLVLAAMVALIAVSRLYRPVSEDAAEHQDGQHQGGQHQGGQHQGGQHHHDHPNHHDDDRPARRRFSGFRRVSALAVLLLAAGALTVAGPARAQAATRFNRTAVDQTNTWSAASYFTCKSAALATSPYFYYQLGEASGALAADSSGNARTGLYQGRLTHGAAGSCGRDNHTAVTLNGSSGCIATLTAVANPTVFTEEIWFRTSTTSGGTLIGFGNTQTGSPTNYDRNLYLTNGGQVVFGVYTGSVRTITSPKAYNDGSWHLADAVLSGAGMQLYLDGQLVSADAGVTAAQNYIGFWHIGYNNLAGWTSVPSSSFLNATVDNVAVYSSALTATQIADNFAAA